jgi:hypothetical protein
VQACTGEERAEWSKGRPLAAAHAIVISRCQFISISSFFLIDINEDNETKAVTNRSASQQHRRPQQQHLAVLAAHGDMLPRGIDGGNRHRRAKEGDGYRVFIRLVCNSALALEYAEDVALGRDEELADLVLTGASLRKCEDDALQNAPRLLPSFTLYVTVTCRASDTRDKCVAVVREFHTSVTEPLTVAYRHLR